MRAQEITLFHFRRVASKCLVYSGIVVAALAWSTDSLADDVDVFGPVRDERPGPKESEQSLAFELRFGPYLPALPNQANATPSFGEQIGRSHRIMVGVEADWQALRIPGILSLGPGAGMAYTKLTGEGTYNDGTLSGGYSASLKIWAQWVEAVLRFDYLQQKYAIPFVFSGKLGAARATWWSGNRPYYNDAFNVSTSGSAQGLAWALGAMFDLGFLEPERARRMDSISGVNHMYLFWEWYQLKLDDFGRGVNQVGDSTWALGWAVDM
jgi:hypothetical protein